MRPVIFVDLSGTLIVRDPDSGRWVAWTGVAGLLYDLARDHDLHLTTGDTEPGARAALDGLGVSDLFAGIHADLPLGGKPFGALARELRRDPERCLVVGDDPVADTARDSDAVVSLLLRHETAQVPVSRVRAVVDGLGRAAGFLAGFEDAFARSGHERDAKTADALQELPVSVLGPDCRLGWWRKGLTGRRPVVVLVA